MTDDLVQRLRDIAVHSYLGRSVIEEAAYRIEALTAERDQWAASFDEACAAWQQQCEHEMDKTKAAEAERDRLREALNQSRLAFAGYVSVQSAIDLIDRAALKGETP